MRPTSSGAKWRNCRSAAEWKVPARTPVTPSARNRARNSPPALSVKVTAMSCVGSNAPDATWCAMRRVIVVVLPEPAPARMQTGPRTASAARRCSGFNPSRASTAPPYPRQRTGLVKLLSRKRVFFVRVQRRRRLEQARRAHHRREPRHGLERLTFPYQPLQLGELVLQPDRVDDRAAHAHDLRVRGRHRGLARAPELLVQLLAGPRPHNR